MTLSPIHGALQWSGSTAGPRSTLATASAAGKPPIVTSVAPDYGGEAAHWNPDDLFGAALSACMMYTFLSIARKARLDVRSYKDAFTVSLVTEGHRTRIEQVALSPLITLAAGGDPDRAAAMLEKCHRYCVISNSTTARVTLQPTIHVQQP